MTTYVITTPTAFKGTWRGVVFVEGRGVTVDPGTVYPARLLGYTVTEETPPAPVVDDVPAVKPVRRARTRKAAPREDS